MYKAVAGALLTLAAADAFALHPGAFAPSVQRAAHRSVSALPLALRPRRALAPLGAVDLKAGLLDDIAKMFSGLVGASGAQVMPDTHVTIVPYFTVPDGKPKSTHARALHVLDVVTVPDGSDCGARVHACPHAPHPLRASAPTRCCGCLPQVRWKNSRRGSQHSTRPRRQAP